METRLSGIEKEVVVSPDAPTVLIGERINPTGRKRLAQALERGDLGVVEKEAMAQAGLIQWSGSKLSSMAPVARTRGERTVADLLVEDRV